MSRGRRGDAIFADNIDRQNFIRLLKEAADLWNVRVSGFCLMDNHYHILAQTPQGNLSRFMRHLNGVYTQRYNRLHDYDGQLFRGRYKSILVAADSHLLELIRYIHLNPVRAQIVNSPDQYLWSSHQRYLVSPTEPDWLYKDLVLSMLTTNKKRQLQAYGKFMAQDESQELLDLFEKKKWPIFLGGKDFVSWVKDTFFQKKKDRQIPESFQLAPDRDRIIEEVCRKYGVKEQDLFTVRRGIRNEPRDVAIYLCRILRNDTLKELGKAFGITGYSPGGSVVSRVRKELIQDEKLEQYIENITYCVLNGDVSQSET